ncbi:MAG: SusD/RagB family nutrient-binding outer membrane lipoprotein [Bacteroidota bacterium]|nr:SusD/RagB family nutrient-binding outer membrane lipoprotein [Bacteroidota bacterium]
MKNIKFKFIGVLILAVLVLGSCKKWIDTGINVNPDAPTDVPMSSLLPAIQANMAYNLQGGNDLTRVTSIWMQYFQGVGRQSQGEANYIWHDGDVDNLWNTTYATVMNDLVILTNKAVTSNNKTFMGISDVLMALSLGPITDVFGDIPYTEAFQGMSNLNPAFNSQQEIYDTIISRLNHAIVCLSDPKAVIIHGDIMYGGDPSLWLKAAYGLKARYILHTCKVNTNAYTDALAAVKQSLTDVSEDLSFQFYDGSGYQNPFYQFMIQRGGDMTMHKTFTDMLILRVDPRLHVFVSPVDTIWDGADWGSTGENASTPGPAVNSGSSAVPFFTYAECLFIKAECEYKTLAPDADVRTDLVNGLKASLNQYGVYSDAYVAAYEAATSTFTGDALYKEVMVQKYIALYDQLESYNDWRRTDNAIGLKANPTSAAQETEIPRRFPYSLGEKSYNSNTPKNVTIIDRVWWDKKAK